MISFSTCWNSSRHTAGDKMLREIKTKLGFDLIELGHGIRISLMPGIQKMFEAGEVRFSSLHNFCPLPVEVMGASPDCYTFSSSSPRERERAVRQTMQTIDFAERLGAPFVILHLGRVPIESGDRAVDRARENGRDLFEKLRAPESGRGREARSGGAGLPREREGMPEAGHGARRHEKHPARHRRPARLRGNPERARVDPACSTN